MKETDNNNKTNHFKMESPLEFIGMGFLLMLGGGAFFYFASGGKTLEAFAWSMIFMYAIIAAPLILSGVGSLFGIFDYLGIQGVAPNRVLIAHYVALLARLSNASYKCSIIIFIVVFAVSALIFHLAKKRKKEK